ncbi:MAG: CBS domain-containing protein, partial [Candidatus Uhrbacteria bacterium]|nr:CBS domain-containing protein [Candidatus Uhrbacteria bacterium]
VAKPIAWVLDKTLGEELKVIWTKRELEHIISMHEDDPRSGVDADEERIILGALRFSEKTAKQVMTPRGRVFMLSSGDMLGEKLLERVQMEGFTRIPVYEEEKEEVVGLIFAKDLLGIESARSIAGIMRTDRLVRVTPGRKLDEILNLMIARRSHMALVTEKNGTFVGIVTLEDVIEEIIGREIHDEDDDAPPSS